MDPSCTTIRRRASLLAGTAAFCPAEGREAAAGRLLVSDYIALMKHAIRMPNPRTGHNLYNTLNQAGRALFAHHPWSWRMQGPVEIPAVAGSDRIALPADFSSLESCTLTNTSLTPRIVSVVEWNDRSRLGSANGGTYWLSFQQQRPGQTAGTRPQPGVLIFPTPDTDGTPTLRIFYKAGWRTIEGEIDNTLPCNIPESHERALQLIAQAMAVQVERDDDAPSSYAEHAKAELDRLVGEDVAIQPNAGTLRGGRAEDLARSFGVDDPPLQGLLQVVPD